MISTRENLLIRPWQQRKYENHKQKVLSATSVIDTAPPPYRGHVAVKLKKLQKETERSRKIERDNLILLQRLNYIMTTHWLDNYLPPQPAFLSRVGVYGPAGDPGIDAEDLLSKSDYFDSQQVIEDALKLSRPNQCRKLKCLACSPFRLVDTLTIPEERVPWEPQKKAVGRKRSSSVPPKPKRFPETLATIKEKPKSANSLQQTKKPDVLRAKNQEKPQITLLANKDVLTEYQNSISIARGSVKLSVNFPTDATVKFDKKRLGRNLICRCLRSGHS